MADVGILGGAAVRGNPDGMASVARLLRTTADEIHSVRGTLERSGMQGIWEGAASEAFRALLHTTPEDLSKAARSYTHAADTVEQYAGRLRGARDRAQTLANQLEAANRRVGLADHGVRTAHSAVAAARRAYNATHDPAQRSRAYQVLNDRLRAAAAADRERTAAGAQVESIRRQAAENRRALDDVARWAQEQMHHASVAGIRNSAGSYWNRHIAPGLDAAWDGTVMVAKYVTETLVKAATLPYAVADYLRDPSAANLSTLLDHVSAALTVLTFAAMVAAIVVTGGTAAAFLPAFIATLKWTSVAVGVAKVGVDSYRLGKGDENVSYADLAFDAVGVGISFGGAKSFHGEVDGWARGMKVQPHAWDKYALRTALFNEGKPSSNALLPGQIKKQMLIETRDLLRLKPLDLALDGSKAFVNTYNPVVGTAKDWGAAQNLIQNGTTVVKHSIKNIQIRPIVPMPIAIPQVAR